MSERLTTPIYIDGKKHLCTGISAIFFADHPDLPGRPCSQHNIGREAVGILKYGQAVHTGGHTYSVTPPAEDRLIPSKLKLRALPKMRIISIPSIGRVFGWLLAFYLFLVLPSYWLYEIYTTKATPALMIKCGPQRRN